MVRMATALAFLTITAAPAFAGPMKFAARLTGAQQNPAVATTAEGKVTVKFDEGFTQMEVKVTVNGLADVTNAHFHCNRPGADGSVAFGLIAPGPCTLVANQINCTLTNADVQANTCDSSVARPVNNIAALAFAMRDGLIYANVHSTAFPTGEIRGQMVGK